MYSLRGAAYNILAAASGRMEIIMLDRIALVLVIIGAVNWGSIGLFRFDIVSWIFGGQSAVLSRIVFSVVFLAGLWCISLLFRRRAEIASRS